MTYARRREYHHPEIQYACPRATSSTAPNREPKHSLLLLDGLVVVRLQFIYLKPFLILNGRLVLIYHNLATIKKKFWLTLLTQQHCHGLASELPFTLQLYSASLIPKSHITQRNKEGIFRQ